MSSVFECKEALIECFEIVQEDSVSTREATGLKHFLEDEELNFFSRIMPLQHSAEESYDCGTC